MARATASPDIVGMILTGSHTRGMATAHSDFDVILVSTAASHTHRRRPPRQAVPPIPMAGSVALPLTAGSVPGSELPRSFAAGRSKGAAQDIFRAF